jgi:hypothetical protein
MSQTQRSLLFYAITLLLFGGAIYMILLQGGSLRPALDLPASANELPGVAADPWSSFQHTLIENIHHPLALLLMQIVAIIAAARLFGMLFS